MPKHHNFYSKIILGHLYENEKFKVFGYCSTSKIKFLAIYDITIPTRDNEAKQLLKSLHSNYIDAISNPFFEEGQPIRNQRFIQANKSLLRSSS